MLLLVAVRRCIAALREGGYRRRQCEAGKTSAKEHTHRDFRRFPHASPPQRPAKRRPTVLGCEAAQHPFFDFLVLRARVCARETKKTQRSLSAARSTISVCANRFAGSLSSALPVSTNRSSPARRRVSSLLSIALDRTTA